MEMRKLFIDFETRSEADLSAVGAFKYCQDPTTEVTLVAWAFDDDSVQVCGLDDVPDRLVDAISDIEILKIAHNAEFDMCVSRECLGVQSLVNWHDTAFQAAYYGYPRSLANLAGYLNTKQKASQEELRLFSQPVKTKRVKGEVDLFGETQTVWDTSETHPEEWARFVEYARADVEVMRECYNKMPELPEIEKEAMRLTFEMNFNGVPFDVDLAARIMDRVKEYETNAETQALANYEIKNLRSVQQVKTSLEREGVFLDSLNAKTRGNNSHDILELRDQAVGAAFRKLPTAYSRLCPDGRLHGEFKGNGAHTGRWSSSGVQLQNWARILEPDKVSETLERVDSYGLLRQHLRLVLGHERGRAFVCADLAQIEARIVAWMAGCKWRMDAFADGVDIYSRSAEKMFKKPVKKGDIERQYGKNAELGFGYGGGAAAIDRINHDFYTSIGAEEADKLCQQWRQANPEIVALWYDLMRTFRKAVKTGVANIACGGVLLRLAYDGHTCRVTLPAGRALYYRGIGASQGNYDIDISYTDYGDGHAKTIRLWHGILVENIVQAIARDILVDIMRRVKTRLPNAELIGTVHDECWYMVDERVGSPTLDALLSEMAEPIPWAPGLITKGDGFYSDRYRK